MFEGYHDAFDAEARLIILRALNDETDGRLNDSFLTTVLETFGIKRGRPYLRSQINWLRDQCGAVTTRQIGTTLVVEITQQGEDHMERRVPIEGIKLPSRKRG